IIYIVYNIYITSSTCFTSFSNHGWTNFRNCDMIEAGVSSSRWASNFSPLIHTTEYNAHRFDLLSCELSNIFWVERAIGLSQHPVNLLVLKWYVHGRTKQV